MKNIISICFFLSFCLSLSAQSPAYVHYSKANGLTDNECFDVFQDAKSYIWIAHEKGIDRFDGRNFVHYGLNNGILGSGVLHLFEDEKSRLWIVPYNFLLSYYYKGKIHPFTYNKKIEEEVVFSTSVCRKGSFRVHDDCLYFGIEYIGYYKLSPKTGIEKIQFENDSCRYVIIDNFKDGKPWCIIQNQHDNNYYSVYENNKENYQFEDKQTKYYKTGKFLAYSFGDSLYFINQRQYFCLYQGKVINQKAFDNNIEYFLVDTNRRLWFSFYKKGVFVYNDYTLDSLSMHLIPDATVSTIIENQKGSFWISTIDKGVYHFPNLNIKNYAKLTFPTGYLVDFCKDNEGNLWLLNRIDSVYRLSKKDNRIDTRLKIDNNTVCSKLIYDSIGHSLWIGTKNGLYKLDIKSKQIKRTPNISNCTDFVFINDTTIVVASKKSLIHFSTKSNGVFKKTNTPYIIKLLAFQKHNKTLWFANGKGINTIINEEIKTFSLTKKSKTISINDIKFYKNYVFVASGTDGLFIIDYPNKTYQISSKEGLACNNINCLEVDRKTKRLWIGSCNGLNYISFSADRNNEHLVSNLHTHSKLFSSNIEQIKYNGNELFVKTSHGLLFFSDFNFAEQEDVSCTIDKLSVGKNIFYEPQSVDLKHNKKSMRIEFNCSHYYKQKDINYLYRLRSENENNSSWVKTNTNYVDYISLKPGKYCFEVKLENVQNKDNIARVNIDIDEHPWFSKSHKIFYVVVFLVIVIFLNVFRNRHFIKKKKLKNEIILHKIKAKNQQLNIPYILQSFENMEDFLNRRHKIQNSKYLVKLTKYMRTVLQFSDKVVGELEDELLLIQSFIEVEKLRLEKEITLKLSIKDNGQYLFIPLFSIHDIICAIFADIKEGSKEKSEEISIYVEAQQKLFVSIHTSTPICKEEKIQKSFFKLKEYYTQEKKDFFPNSFKIEHDKNNSIIQFTLAQLYD